MGPRKRIQEFGIFSEYCLPILEFLMDKNFGDEISRYDVERELGISGSRAHEALENLRRAHFVRFKNVKASALRDELAKKRKRIYELTLNGLVYLLNENPGKWKHIDKVAEKLPWLFHPIFKNWPFFKQQGIALIVEESLRETFKAGYPLVKTLFVFPPRYKRYLPRKQILGEMDVICLKTFYPGYLEKGKNFWKLLENEERGLEEDIREDERELKRILILTFMNTLFHFDGGFPDVKDARTVRVLEAFNNSPELLELLEKTQKYYRCSKNEDSKPVGGVEDSLREAAREVEDLRNAIRELYEVILEEPTAFDSEKNAATKILDPFPQSTVIPQTLK